VPLVVVSGLLRDHAAERLLEVVSRAAADGRSALMAVPSDADAVLMRERLSRPAPVGVRVATLDGVVAAEWALTGDGSRLVRGLAREVLLCRAMLAAGVTDRPGSGATDVLGMLVSRGATKLPLGGDGGDDLPERIAEALAIYAGSLSERRLIESVAACAVLADTAPPAEVIAVDGFVELALEFESLLIGWSACGAEVHVSLPWRPDSPGVVATSGSIERLIGAGARVRPVDATGSGRPAELDRVRQELFAAPRPRPGAGSVTLAVTDGEESEARHVAHVAAGLVEAGARPGAVVIAFADPARHEAWLRRALRDEGVDADFGTDIGVGETPFGRALLLLRACSLGRCTGPEAGELLRSPFSGERLEKVDSAIQEWRRRGDRSASGLLSNARELESIITDASDLKDSPIRVDEASRWKNLVDRLLANAHRGVAPVPDRTGAIDAAVHRAFCGRLQQAVELGEGEVGADEFWERFGSAHVGAMGVRRPDRILVTSVDSVPSGGCDHLILGGLTASEFPRRGSEDRLKGDAIVRAMVGLGIRIEDEEQVRAERRSFYLAVIAPRETLTLVRRGTDDEGAPVRESVFWDEFLDLYRAPGSSVPDGALPDIEYVGLRSGGRSGGRRSSRGKLDGEDARACLAETEEVSPSEVETYLACPYRWFIERRVSVKPPDLEVSIALAGQLMHAALARFYREWLARGNTRVDPGTLVDATALAAECARSVSEEAVLPETLEERLLIDGIEPAVTGLVERDSTFLPGYAPVRVEWAFGGSNDAPALDLGGVKLAGRADRIDVGSEGLVVVDYKRTHASSLAEIRRNGLVQVPLYAVAASHALGLPVAGGLYRGLKEGADRGFVLPTVSGSFKAADVIDRDGIDGLLSEAVDAAFQAVSGMREGRIGPIPSAENCRYCTAAGFCGQAVRA
jgi:RecB family exonuclease